MKLRFTPLFGIVLGLLLAAPGGAQSQDSSEGSKLEVHVNYSGSGTVDEKHKIYVVLWDSPDFVKGVMNAPPVELRPASSKTVTVIFTDVKKSPAYVSCAFDPKGEWDGQSGPPPDGSSLGLYHTEAGQAAPIDVKSGKTTTVELTFDDSVKMQSGHPQGR